MLAMVADASGKPATIHKTYITSDGTKAAVQKVRMFCAGAVPSGGAVRLAPARGFSVLLKASRPPSPQPTYSASPPGRR